MDPLSVGELRAALSAAKNNRRGGPSGLPMELFKWMADEDLEDLAKFYQKCLDTCTCPQDWSRADVVGIFKKGSHRLPSNYRPTSFLEAAYKLLCRVIAVRLQAALGPVINSTQYGFMSNRSTIDAISIFRRAIEL
eukprot:5150412-Alexandrium_andersonii.AAC.1